MIFTHNWVLFPTGFLNSAESGLSVRMHTPPMPRIHARLFLAFVALAVAAAAQEQTRSVDGPAPFDRPPEGLPESINGLFNIDLPRLDPPGTFNLHFNPRLGDLVKRDYIRVPTGVRWTVNDSLRLSFIADAYGTHGLKNAENHTYGISMLRFGSKYVLRNFPERDCLTSVDLNVQSPVGSPPHELTDGLIHVTPSFITEHRLETNPRITLFGGMSVDFVFDSPVYGNVGKNTPRDDSVSIDAGAVYDLGRLKWTLQTTFTSGFIGDHSSFNSFTVRPSVLWYVPRKYTLNSKTQWVIGFGLRSTWGPDGHELSQSSRARAEITFRQVMNNIRDKLERIH